MDMSLRSDNRAIVYKVIWIVFALCSTVLFDFYWDQAGMIYCGKLILDGHIADMYEEIRNVMGTIGIYPIFLPLVYAVWNAPLKLLGLLNFDMLTIPYWAMLWNKLIPIAFFFATGMLVERIALKSGLEDNAATRKLWYYSPLPFFITFIMGMYDTSYAFFTTLGLYFFFSDWGNAKNRLFFCLAFGVSLCCKPFGAFFFIALLLIKEKKILRVLGMCAVFAVPYILCTLPYIHSAAYVNMVMKFPTTFLPSTFCSTFGLTNVFIVAMVVLYSYAYIRMDASAPGWERRALLSCYWVGMLFYGMNGYHPQHLMLLTPFLVLALLCGDGKYAVAGCFVQVGLMICVWLKYGSSSGGMYYFLTDGILGLHGFDLIKDAGIIYDWPFKNVFNISNLQAIAQSVFFGGLIFIGLAASSRSGAPAMTGKNWKRGGVYSEEKRSILPFSLSRPQMLAVLLAGILSFQIPAVISYLPSTERYVYGSDVINAATSTVQEIRDQAVSQRIILDREVELRKLIIRPVHWNLSYEPDDTLTAVLRSADGSESVLGSWTLQDLQGIADGQFRELDIPRIKVQPGEYTIQFTRNCESETANAFSLATLGGRSDADAMALFVGDAEIPSTDLQMALAGRVYYD